MSTTQLLIKQSTRLEPLRVSRWYGDINTINYSEVITDTIDCITIIDDNDVGKIIDTTFGRLVNVPFLIPESIKLLQENLLDIICQDVLNIIFGYYPVPMIYGIVNRESHHVVKFTSTQPIRVEYHYICAYYRVKNKLFLLDIDI